MYQDLHVSVYQHGEPAGFNRQTDDGYQHVVHLPLYFEDHSGVPEDALPDKRPVDSGQQGGDGTQRDTGARLGRMADVLAVAA